MCKVVLEKVDDAFCVVVGVEEKVEQWALIME
jgi:hypothetical protein